LVCGIVDFNEFRAHRLVVFIIVNLVDDERRGSALSHDEERVHEEDSREKSAGADLHWENEVSELQCSSIQLLGDSSSKPGFLEAYRAGAVPACSATSPPASLTECD
jgi:hypothetical protein